MRQNPAVNAQALRANIFLTDCKQANSKSRETMMRNCVLVLAAVAALVSGTAILDPASAVVLSSAGRAPAEADAINPIEKAACWRPGWHGWGWYPYCGPPRVVEEVWEDEPACREITVH
jgi:hypothetical protein